MWTNFWPVLYIFAGCFMTFWMMHNQRNCSFDPDSFLVSSRSVRSSGSTTAAWVWPRHLKGSGIAHSVQPPWRGGEAGTNKCQVTWANLSDMTVPLDWECTCYITMRSGCVDVCERSLPERWCGCCVCLCKSQPIWAFLAGESKHTLPSKLFLFLCFSLHLH